jgi:type IV secretory pathway TrbD component
MPLQRNLASMILLVATHRTQITLNGLFIASTLMIWVIGAHLDHAYTHALATWLIVGVGLSEHARRSPPPLSPHERSWSEASPMDRLHAMTAGGTRSSGLGELDGR